MALAAGGNADRLAEQVRKYRPSRHALAAERGPDCLIDIATHPDADVVLFASSGTAALDAVLAAIDAGKTIALANKEILVMAGSVVMAAAKRKGVAVLPVDSEHNAHSPVPARPTAERGPQADPDGVGRPVPWALGRRARARDRGRRAAPSDVAHGTRRSPSTRRR